MKTLVVVRHAKSSWKYPQLTDSERPLNNRGHKNAPEMGKRLRKYGIDPDLIISSKANRALTTAKYIAAKLKYPEDRIMISGELYHTLDEEMFDWIRTFDNTLQTVMIFGHNPGFTDLVNYLTGSDIYNVPTAGVAVIEFDTNWNEIEVGSGRLAIYDYPKKLSD